MLNIVELIQDDGADVGFDQPCKFGHRVEGHAVYCHNDGWLDSPRKCRCTWYSGGKNKDEDCPGFQANPNFHGTLTPSPPPIFLCSKCNGAKLIADGEHFRTCPRCMGDAAEPTAMAMTQYEQDTLESAFPGAREHGECFLRVAETNEETDAVHKLASLDLVVIRCGCHLRGATVYMLESTEKGWTVLKANWDLKRKRK